MFKREFKVNFKSLCIWGIITILLFIVVFLVYPSMINESEVDLINEMLKEMPDEILKSFNMDISSLENTYGWLKSEGFIFILLIIGSYAGILGSNILLKEESDKTIEYLGVMPIKRTNIILIKSLVGVINIVILTVVVGVFNYIGLYMSGEFDKKQYILLSLTPLLSSITVFFVCLFFSTFTSKTKKMLGVSLCIVLVSYVLNTLSTISEKIEYLKYFSVFTLSDIRNVIINVAINYKMVVISIIISAVFLLLTIVKYNKKELV